MPDRVCKSSFVVDLFGFTRRSARPVTSGRRNSFSRAQSVFEKCYVVRDERVCDGVFSGRALPAIAVDLRLYGDGRRWARIATGIA